MIHHGNWIREDYPHLETLTPQEQKVFQCLVNHAGEFSKIQDELCITKSTLKAHLISIYRKIDAHSKLEAVLIGLRAGLVSLPLKQNTEPLCVFL